MYIYNTLNAVHVYNANVRDCVLYGKKRRDGAQKPVRFSNRTIAESLMRRIQNISIYAANGINGVG